MESGNVRHSIVFGPFAPLLSGTGTIRAPSMQKRSSASYWTAWM